MVMISPAHRKPRVYAVGKVSRKWPKVLMLKVARKQATLPVLGPVAAVVAAPADRVAPQIVPLPQSQGSETCI